MRERDPRDQSPNKKQRRSCLFASYKHSLPSTYINCEAQLVKYLNAINEHGFSADVELDICTSSGYLCLRPLFASISEQNVSVWLAQLVKALAALKHVRSCVHEVRVQSPEQTNSTLASIPPG